MERRTTPREKPRRPTPRTFEQPLSDLSTRLRGDVVRPDSDQYDEARRVYNGMIDRRPRVIARCNDVADVIAAVRFGRSQGLVTAVRSGGHSGPGFGTCDQGLVIDLSPMRGILVDPKGRTATVQAGCRWGDVDHATHVFGLAAPSGIIASTGVAGLTLGGGHGYLTRKYGLTIDNLLSATVVLADGRFVEASEREHADLFWAIRGGGGNFGIVTAFRFRLHPVDVIHGGPTFWPLEAAEDVMRWYDGFIGGAPDDRYGFFAFTTVPPAPPFPEAIQGRKVCGVVWCCLNEKEAETVRAATSEPAEPLFQHVGAMPFPALQSMHDVFYPPGLQWYWRGHFVDALSEDAIATHARFGRALPSMLSTMHLYPIDGAVHRVAEDAMAWSRRDARYSQVIVGVDPDPDNAAEITAWTKAYSDAVKPHAAGGAYVNFMTEGGVDRLRDTYRGNFDRLVAIKRTYDPDNFFHLNQNIPPA